MTLAEKLRFLANRAEDGKEFLVGRSRYRFIDGEIHHYCLAEGWTKSEYYFNELIGSDIENQEKHWVFTEDEKAILRNLDEKIQWIARDENEELWLYYKKPKKRDVDFNLSASCSRRFSLYDHLFKDVKWEDDEPCEFRGYLMNLVEKGKES